MKKTAKKQAKVVSRTISSPRTSKAIPSHKNRTANAFEKVEARKNRTSPARKKA